MDPNVVDPVALTTFPNSFDDDLLLRKAAAQYALHISDVLGSPQLWSTTYEPLSRQNDREKVSVCFFLPHEWVVSRRRVWCGSAPGGTLLKLGQVSTRHMNVL